MTRKNLAYFDGQYGYLTSTDDYDEGREIITTGACCDRYIKIDDGKQYPQLCAGGKYHGNTLIWAKEWEDIPQQFARDCNARLYKTRKGYDRARAKHLASIAYPNQKTAEDIMQGLLDELRPLGRAV